MKTPPDLRYTQEHEWARLEGEVVTVGITDFAQEQLSDVVYVELPEVGRTISRSDSFGLVEAVKTVSDLYAPVSGEIVEVNGRLADEPGLVNESPYENGWMVKIRASNPEELESLLDAEGYRARVAETEA